VWYSYVAMNKDAYQDFLVAHKSNWKTNSPCFVVNTGQLNDTIEKIQALLSGEIVYSHKTNPHPSITDIVKKHGCGFLLSSVEESEKIINGSKVSPEKLIFQSPSLCSEQYEALKALGISRFIIDSNEQLDLILSGLENMPRKPEVLVRVNTGVTISHPELSYSTDSYLGFPIAEVMPVFKRLNELRKADKIIVGLHNHLLSQNTFLKLWKKNLAAMTDYVEKLKKEGILLDIVDFGGGYPIDYGKETPLFEEVAALIANATGKMSEVFPALRFIFEPGRKVVGESITLIGKVIHVKEFKKTKVAILNCSVYNSSLDTLIVDLFLPVDKIKEDNKKPLQEYVLRGSTPDSLDIFNKKVKLAELNPGDYLAFFHAGAYSLWSDFISLKKPDHLFL